MLSNKVKNENDWVKEGKIKNTKYIRSSTAKTISVTDKKAKTQGLFNDNLSSLKGFSSLYSVYKDMGVMDVLNHLDEVWDCTTNSNLKDFENNLLAISVYLDVDQEWLDTYNICTNPFWGWFNNIKTGVKRPSCNYEIAKMKYNYFRLYLISLLNM
jgi:hypothetical protein